MKNIIISIVLLMSVLQAFPSNPVSDEDDDYTRQKDFKGHWTGFEFGLNNYLTKDFSMQMPDEYKFMELNAAKSWQFNLNIPHYSLGIHKDNFGLVTGLGIEWNNYRFEDETHTIHKDPNTGNITDYADTTLVSSYSKSKMTTSYLVVPILFEFQFPNDLHRKRRAYISTGVLGGMNIGSKTKVVYTDNGDKKKVKNRGDLNISPFKYGFTFRLGYRRSYIFANYYNTPLFKKSGDPELYPFMIGMRLFIGI